MLRLSVALILLIVISACKKKVEPEAVDTILDCGVELHAIDALSDDTILTVGGDRYFYGRAYITYDGGMTWNYFDTLSEKALYACKCVNTNRFIAAGLDGKYFESNDAGHNWVFSQLFFWKPVRAIESYNNYTWLAGGDGLKTGFVTHDNGFGLSQLQRDTVQNEMRSLLFVDSGNLFAAGYGLVTKSSDLGNTWQPTSAEGDFFIGLVNVNGKIYAGGMNGTVLESDNYGSTWSHVKHGNNPAQLGTIWNAFDGNENGLVIAGENGKINWYDLVDEKWFKLDANIDDDITGVKMIGNKIYCSTRQGHVLRLELP